jgi:release factor glutamine methyltransferase
MRTSVLPDLAVGTRREAFVRLRRAFAKAGLDTPELDARVLLTDALRIEPAELLLRPEESVGEDEAALLSSYAARRLAGEPVARILGVREFWGLPFALSPATLVPRPDTETVVEAALGTVRDRSRPVRLIDLGAGSGCLLVALLHELREATGIAVDLSEEALRTARQNAARNGVGERAQFAASRWGAALAGSFDLIVSNPPYIATEVLAALPPEVREHDPALALDGGADGLDAYRAILADAGGLLAPGGALVLEIGYDQEPALQAMAPAAGFAVERTARDLGGHPRAVVIRRPQA